MQAKPQQEGAAVKGSLKSSDKTLQKYKGIQACSVGREQPKEIIDQWKTKKKNTQKQSPQIVTFQAVCSNAFATLSNSTHWHPSADAVSVTKRNDDRRDTKFVCNPALRQEGLQSYLTSYRASNPLLTILWVCVNSWRAGSSSCLTLTSGVMPKVCAHMLNKTYSPSSSWSFWQLTSNSTAHCPSLLPEESLKYYLGISVKCSRGFPPLTSLTSTLKERSAQDSTGFPHFLRQGFKANYEIWYKIWPFTLFILISLQESSSCQS